MVTVKNSTKKQRKTARQIKRRREFQPINSNSSQASVGKSAFTAAQHAFNFQQKQNRRWLHSQVILPDSNGIANWQHRELFDYFTKSTLEEQSIELSTESQQHLARLTQERNNEKQKLELALDMTTNVKDWWAKDPIPAGLKGRKAGEKRPRPENRKAKRIREFIERKDKETEQKGQEEQLRREISKMQIGDEAPENVTDEEDEDFDDEEVAMGGFEEQEEKIAPHRWVDELTFRGPRP